MSVQLDSKQNLKDVVFSKIGTIVCLSIVAFLEGCSSVTTINATNSAHVPEVAKLKTVAVYPFEGRYGDIYRSEMESLLVNVNLKGKRYFSVIESAKLDNVINAQRLGAVYDESTAAKVGRLVGARGIFMGSVATDTVTDNSYSTSSQQCVSQSRKGKCTSWRNVSVSCTKRIADIGFIVRLVNVETGIQSYNNHVTGQAISDVCRGSNQALENREVLRKRAREVAYEKIRKDVAPYTVNLDIKLMDDADGIESDHAKEKLESGISFAEVNRLDRACELWQEARALAPRSKAIIYNIGVCAEAAGELDNALALYQEADRLLSSPDPIINEALERVGKRLNNKVPIGP